MGAPLPLERAGEFYRALGTGSRPAIRSEDDIAGEVITDPVRADADPLATQILEIAYAGIGPSDNRKCFRIKCDYRASSVSGPAAANGPSPLKAARATSLCDRPNAEAPLSIRRMFATEPSELDDALAIAEQVDV